MQFNVFLHCSDNLKTHVTYGGCPCLNLNTDQSQIALQDTTVQVSLVYYNIHSLIGLVFFKEYVLQKYKLLR